MRRLFGFSLTLLFILAINISAQTQVGPKYDVDRFDITAKIDTAANSADITTILKLTNTGNAPGRSITLRFGSGKVSAVSVNGSSATFSQRADNLSNALQIIANTPPGNIAPKASVNVSVTYTYTVAEGAANASIGPGDVVLLPDGGWVPVANTPILAHGPD